VSPRPRSRTSSAAAAPYQQLSRLTPLARLDPHPPYLPHLTHPTHATHQTHPTHATYWNRDEWDVALSDGAVYRIFFDHVTERWFIDAIVD
jgi:hypothetical protein